MFGPFGKPKWTLVFRDNSENREFRLCSDSIGKILGYIDIQLEKAVRPKAVWDIHLEHSSGRKLSIEDVEAGTTGTSAEIIKKSLGIDPKVRRSSFDPTFYMIEANKKTKLSLTTELNGRPVQELSLTDRMNALEQGQQESISIFYVVRSAFDEVIET